MWDGTISYNEFYIAAKSFCEKWKESNTTLPNWIWVPSKQEEGYLSLENVHYAISSKDCDGEEEYFGEEELIDSATLIEYPNNETHVYDFHIVYNFSYRVPILYFRGYHCDGRPLNLDDIQKVLPNYSVNLLNESKWTFMTQEEHPMLHCPWYMLHPCGTSDLMKLLLGNNPHKDVDNVRYLPSWLSVVGQAVGLRIPLKLHAQHSKWSETPINDDVYASTHCTHFSYNSFLILLKNGVDNVCMNLCCDLRFHVNLLKMARQDISSESM